MAGVPGGSRIWGFKTPEMPTKKGIWASSGILCQYWHTARRCAAQQECNNGERQTAGAKNNPRTNNSEIRHEGWEGVPVCNSKEFRQIASLGGIVEELLHKTPCDNARMEATIPKPGCGR